MKEVITHGFEETRELGFQFAKALKGGEVLCLYGDLGSGKTTFMQGVANGLGVTRKVLSPTFIIMRTYDIGINNEEVGSKHLYHVDLYRIEGEKDVEGLGLMELMGDKENIVAIEWPEKIANALPRKRTDIHFEYMDENTRKIRY